jgi:arsenate reductase
MKIAFLCTANSARSQMSEGIARSLSENAIEVYSAGSKPADQVNPYAVTVMKEIGIDISHHTPKGIEELPKNLDLLITVCSNAAEECPMLPGYKVIHWNLPDPASVDGDEENKLTAFREIRDEIKRRTQILLKELLQTVS